MKKQPNQNTPIITMTGSFNLDDISEMVLVREIKAGETTKGLYVNVSPDVKTHENLRHTTTVEKFGCIINNLTLRCSSLTSSKLNDKKEKERVSVEKFAPSRFISCFSHIKHESVPFWSMYGDKLNNIQLVFKNFGNFFSNVIWMDYCLSEDGKRIFFKSDECNRVLNSNSPMLRTMLGLPLESCDYDTRNWIESIEMIDIEYLSADHESFIRDYSSPTSVYFGNDENAPIINTTQYSPNCLGRQKSDPWVGEEESRILCCLSVQDFDKWSYIDLRLKEEIFRDLKIILNPWANENLEQEVQTLIDNSQISDDIKSSISIQRSSVEGTINL